MEPKLPKNVEKEGSRRSAGGMDHEARWRRMSLEMES